MSHPFDRSAYAATVYATYEQPQDIKYVLEGIAGRFAREAHRSRECKTLASRIGRHRLIDDSLSVGIRADRLASLVSTVQPHYYPAFAHDATELVHATPGHIVRFRIDGTDRNTQRPLVFSIETSTRPLRERIDVLKDYIACLDREPRLSVMDYIIETHHSEALRENEMRILLKAKDEPRGFRHAYAKVEQEWRRDTLAWYVNLVRTLHLVMVEPARVTTDLGLPVVTPSTGMPPHLQEEASRPFFAGNIVLTDRELIELTGYPPREAYEMEVDRRIEKHLLD